jgi:hypothetical protein
LVGWIKLSAPESLFELAQRALMDFRKTVLTVISLARAAWYRFGMMGNSSYHGDFHAQVFIY